MRKTVWISLMLLVCCAWALAQTNTDQTGTGQTSPSSSQTGSTGSSSDQMGSNSKENQTTITGCLSGSNGNFTLTDAAGMQYQLQGDTSKLSQNVDKEVRVKGSASGSGAGMSGGMGAGASAGTSTAGGTNSDTTAGTSTGAGAGTSAAAGGAQMFNVTSVKKVSDTCKASK